MPEIHDMAARRRGGEQLARGGRRRRGSRGQDRGLEITLDGALRMALRELAEIDAPIYAEHLGRQVCIGVDEVRRVL